MLSAVSLQLAKQGGKHAFDLLDQVFQRSMGRCWEETKVTREHQLTFQLTSRTEGHLNEAREIQVAAATAAFCEIGANRYSGTPHLIGETVLFAGGKRFSRPVRLQGETVSQLPDFEFPKILHDLRLIAERLPHCQPFNHMPTAES